MLLALDTATPFVSVALVDETAQVPGIHGEGAVAVLAEHSSTAPMRHGELLVPTVQQVLAEAGVEPFDVTALVVGIGPGPFTGLRVGLVTARVLALTWSLPVYGVCSLDGLAVAALESGTVSADERFLVATDARRKEVYWATYADGRREDGPHVSRPDQVAELVGDAGLPVVGHGATLYPEAFADARGPAHPPASALALALADERVELYDPEPLYLRRPDAAVPGTPKRVS